MPIGIEEYAVGRCHKHGKLYLKQDFSTSSNWDCTPYEIVNKNQPDMFHRRLFGGKLFVHVPTQIRNHKLSCLETESFWLGMKDDLIN